jgi:hypothetical protein
MGVGRIRSLGLDVHARADVRVRLTGRGAEPEPNTATRILPRARPAALPFHARRRAAGRPLEFCHVRSFPPRRRHA